MQIRIHAVETNITTLGPGRRFGIWVQGCDRKCPGCMSPETWNPKGGTLYNTSELAEMFLHSGCDGITISGGEAFLQPDALAEVIRLSGNPGVIIYTGFLYEELLLRQDAAPLLAVCDLLIDGAFIQKLQDGKNLRGSSNQRALPLTDRYRETAASAGTMPAQIEFFLHDNVTRLVGIPSPEWLERVKKINW